MRSTTSCAISALALALCAAAPLRALADDNTPLRVTLEPLDAAGSGTLHLSFSNLASHGAPGDAENISLGTWLSPGALLTSLSWVVQLDAYDPSWLSELTLALTSSSGEGVQLSPAGELHAPGSLAASGQVDLLNSGLSFRIGADGQLHLDFYDDVDDLPGAADGRWASGTLSIGYTLPVPEPQPAALLLAGLLAVALLRRRRPQPG